MDLDLDTRHVLDIISHTHNIFRKKGTSIMLRALRKERKSKQYTDICVIMSFSVILNDDKNLYHKHGRMNAVCLCLQKDFFCCV